MQVKISAITKINENDKCTYYFIQKEYKIVLPIEYKNTKNIYEDTYIRTLNALNVKIERISIYLYLNNKYYAYLRIKNNNQSYDINTSIANALNILDKVPDTKVYADINVLKYQGIKITKELIEKSLMSGDI